MFGMGMGWMGVIGSGGGSNPAQLYWGTAAIMWNTDEVWWV
jgi:hypothetical protein